MERTKSDTLIRKESLEELRAKIIESPDEFIAARKARYDHFISITTPGPGKMQELIKARKAEFEKKETTEVVNEVVARCDARIAVLDAEQAEIERKLKEIDDADTDRISR
jgi:hypothetical protein